MTYDIKIEDNAIYITENSPYYAHGFKIDIEALGCHDCLNIADKLKRSYYNKLQSGINDGTNKWI